MRVGLARAVGGERREMGAGGGRDLLSTAGAGWGRVRRSESADAARVWFGEGEWGRGRGVGGCAARWMTGGAGALYRPMGLNGYVWFSLDEFEFAGRFGRQRSDDLTPEGSLIDTA